MGFFKLASDAAKLAGKAAAMATEKANELLEENEKTKSDENVTFSPAQVLTIDEGVIALSEDFLENYDGIKKIIFPSTLCTIDSVFFDEHKDIVEVDFSKVTHLKEIPDCLFFDMKKLREITIPEGVEVIGNEVFYCCESLRKIVLPSTLRETGDLCDNGCENLQTIDTSKVHLLKEIPDYFFYYVKDRKVVIPYGVRKIGNGIVGENTHELYIPATVRKVGNLAEVSVENLTTYVFSDNIKDMEGIFNDSSVVHVHESAASKYTKMWKDADSEATLRTMPDDAVYPGNTYPSEDVEIEEEDEDVTHTAEEPEIQQEILPAQVQSEPAVAPPPSPVASSPVVPPPPPVFKYYALLEGNQEGPYDEPQFSRLVQYGMVTSDTYVWTEGMAEWKPASEVAALGRFFRQQAPGAVPPPMPSF